jgi:drug/metabolite transporter (DMT)-like permease
MPAERSTDRRSTALLAVTIAILAWGFGPLLVKGIGVGAPSIVFWRLWLAQPVMIGLAYATGGRLSWALLRRSVVTGVCFGLSVMFAFASFRKTSIANATLIPALQPVIVLLVATRMFGEHRPRSDLVYAGVALAGTAVVVLGASTAHASLVGDLLAVGNLLVFTAYFLLTKRARNDNVHSWSFIAAVFLVAALVCTPWCVAASGGLGGESAGDWLLILLLVLVPGVLGHGLMAWAHHYLDVTLTSLLSLGNPVVSIIGAWAIFGQALGVAQAAGAACVLAALGAILRNQSPDRALGAEAATTGDLLDT